MRLNLSNPFRRRWNTAQLLDEFQDANRARALSPKTLKDFYGACLTPFAAAVPTLPASPNAIERYLASLTRLAPSSRDVHWRALSRFSHWTQARHNLPDWMATIARPVQRQALPRALDREQLPRVLAAATTRRDKAMVLLLLDTGIRLAELANLRRRDVGQVLLLRGKVGHRQVPLSPEVRRLLVGLGKDDTLWIGRRGPLSKTGVQQAIILILRNAGVAEGGPHVLRHTFAVNYLRNGGDLITLQRILGHKSLTMTRRYLELLWDDVETQHRQHSPALALLAATAAAR